MLHRFKNSIPKASASDAPFKLDWNVSCVGRRLQPCHDRRTNLRALADISGRSAATTNIRKHAPFLEKLHYIHQKPVNRRSCLTPYSDSDITTSDYEAGFRPIPPFVRRRPAYPARAGQRRSSRIRHHAGGGPPVGWPLQIGSRHVVRQSSKTTRAGHCGRALATLSR